MPKNAADALALQIVYQGTGPVFWSGGPDEFGVQDKDETLLLGVVGPKDVVRFDLQVGVKFSGEGPPIFSGPFVHGPPKDRFIYLSWRNATGEYAQRFKLPIKIAEAEVRAALASGEPLVAEVIDLTPRATSTGANIGGTRPVVWRRRA